VWMFQLDIRDTEHILGEKHGSDYCSDGG
jgi:hypothetical protein